MNVRTYVPSSPLSAFVELLWLADIDVSHSSERLLPTGSMELVFTLSGPGAVLAGPYSEYAVLDTTKPELVIGAHFRPGGAFAFLPMPAGALHNLDVAVEDVWGADAARSVQARLCEAPTVAAKFAALEEALLRQARTLERGPAVAWAVRELTRGRNVAEVSGAIGMSGRGFIDAFRRETGYTPKVFARIQRFQRLLRRIRGCDDVDWADVALACGFYDQPHLIRDFRAFSGLSPSAYLARRTDHFNHVPM
jgi:AraC-like DNA-binding protein